MSHPLPARLRAILPAPDRAGRRRWSGGALALIVLALAAPAPAQSRGEYDVEWTSPSRDSSGSMPLGNGDVAVNLWVEEKTGDLLFYVAKSDVWSENGRLLKLGRVRVKLTPALFAATEGFGQRLRLATGEIELRAGAGKERATARAWVDANDPIVRVEVSAAAPFAMRVELETWRDERRRLTGDELHSAYGLGGEGAAPVYVEPDVVVPDQVERIVWYHRNARSVWADNLRMQGLGDALAELSDPLLERTFGGTLRAEGLSREGERALVSMRPLRRSEVSVCLLTAPAKSAEEWLAAMERHVRELDRGDAQQRLQEHREWWRAFWERSWIRLSGFPEAEAVSRGYALQRYLAACAGRGRHPIKFNGSLFTFDEKEHGYDADYRRWGGPYWWQNTRLPYWAMLAAGDLDLMEPLWRMYREALPLAKLRTRAYFQHEGAYFPETLTFWGTYADENYGRERKGLAPGVTENRYIRYEWQGGLELLAMMLAAYRHDGDGAFLGQELLPMARELLRFYDLHYPRDAQGELRLEPAQALETFWDVPNPLPEIAGLRHVLTGLLALPERVVRPADREPWTRLLGELPELPTREVDGERLLAAAAKLGERSNSENPELYAVFPYPLFGLRREGLELAHRTWQARDPRGNGGWRQDAIWAALLGLGDEAGAMVVDTFTRPTGAARFPGFHGPNYDWVPDQTHGSVGMIALQAMCLQSVGDEILLLPAWPAGWEVELKLRAERGTTVRASYRGGELASVKIDPPERAARLVRPGE